MVKPFLKGIFILLFLLAACNEEDSVSCDEAVCTEEFRIILVKVEDQNSQVVMLDRIEVTEKSTGQDVTIPVSDEVFKGYQSEGLYLVFDDSKVDVYENEIFTITLKGFLNQEEVLSTDFLIGVDCCHIRLIEGITTVVITI